MQIPGEKIDSHGTPVPQQRLVGHTGAEWHAMATVYRVVGVRGRLRSVIVVNRCPWCSRAHTHTGKPDFTAGKRTASCHGGRYLVHAGVVDGELAA